MKRSFAMILLLCLLLAPAARAMESEILLSKEKKKTDFLGISSVACLDTVDNSQINVLTQRTMHRICTAATNEEVSFAYRVAIPRQRFRWRNAFSTRWRSL